MMTFVRFKNKPTMYRRGLVGLLAVTLALLVSLVPTSAFAAGSTRKTYTIEAANTPVYSGSGFGKKIGAIFATDEVTVKTVTSNYCIVSYPAGGRTKTGYIRTGAILTATRGSSYTSRTRFATYRRPGGASYGSVYAGDQVLVLGTRTSGGVSYTQIKYPVTSGFKYAFARTSDVNASKAAPAPSTPSKPTQPSKPSTTPTASVSTSVRQRLDQIANGSLRYNSSTNMRLGTKFTGTRSSEQCKGFAKNVFYLCFKVTPGSTQSRDKGLNYLISGTSGMTRVGYYSNITSSQAKSLFSKAWPGDFVQIRRRSSGGSHSAIVYSVGSGGITFFEANTDSRNTVMKNYYTWAQLASRNQGMSLYTASSYSLK